MSAANRRTFIGIPQVYGRSAGRQPWRGRRPHGIIGPARTFPSRCSEYARTHSDLWLALDSALRSVGNGESNDYWRTAATHQTLLGSAFRPDLPGVSIDTSGRLNRSSWLPLPLSVLSETLRHALRSRSHPG